MSYDFDNESADTKRLLEKIEDLQTEVDSIPVEADEISYRNVSSNLGGTGGGGGGGGGGLDLSELVQAFIDWYDGLTTEPIDDGMGGTTTVADPTDNPAVILIKGVVHEIDEWWDAVSTGFISWWESPDPIEEPFNTIRTIGNLVWTEAKKVLDWYEGLTTIDIDEDMTGDQTVADPTDNPAVVIIKGIIHEIDEWFKAVSTGFINWWESPDDIDEPFNTIREISRTIWAAVNSVFMWYNELTEPTDGSTPVASESDHPAVRIIKGLVHEITEWFDAVATGFTTWWATTDDQPFKALREMGNSIWGSLKSTWDTLKTWYDTVAAVVSAFVEDPAQYINDLVTTFVVDLTVLLKNDEGVFGAFYEGLTGDEQDSTNIENPAPSNILNDPLRLIGAGLRASWAGVLGWYTKIADAGGELFDDPEAFFEGIASDVTGFFKDDQGPLGAFYEGLTGDEAGSDTSMPNPTITNNSLNNSLKAIGTQLRSIWGTVYDYFFNDDDEFEISDDFITGIKKVLWGIPGSIATGFVEAAENLLFGNQTPLAFAQGTADTQITNSTNSSFEGTIGAKINDKLLSSFTNFGEQITGAIVTFADGAAPFLAGVFDFLENLFVTVIAGITGTDEEDENKFTIDMKNADLVNVDRIFFESNDNPVVTNEPRPTMAGYLNHLWFSVTTDKDFSFWINSDRRLRIGGNDDEGNSTINRFVSFFNSNLRGIGTGTISLLTELLETSLDENTDYLMILDGDGNAIKKIKAGALGGGGSTFNPLEVSDNLLPASDDMYRLGANGNSWSQIWGNIFYVNDYISLSSRSGNLTTSGTIWLDSSHIKARSGSNTVSLSDIFSPLSVPNNLLPANSNAYRLGAAGNVWNEIFGRELRLVGTPSSTPTENGAIWLDGSHIKARSGGGEVSLSDIGGGSGTITVNDLPDNIPFSNMENLATSSMVYTSASGEITASAALTLSSVFNALTDYPAGVGTVHNRLLALENA